VSTGRHRTSPSVLGLPTVVSALMGIILGSGVTALAVSAPQSPAPPVIANANAAAPSSAPPPSPPPTTQQPTTQLPVGSIGFAQAAAGPDGLSMAVLPPEKVKGGIRLTIALVNDTSGPITVNTGELGPHDVRFDGASVPITTPITKKKLMPGEGYTYQCVVKLPTMDVGQLEFTLGSVTVAGQAAGD